MSKQNGHVCNEKGREIEVIVRKGFVRKTLIYKCNICGKPQRKKTF